jgi:hypothetical protein
MVACFVLVIAAGCALLNISPELFVVFVKRHMAVSAAHLWYRIKEGMCMFPPQEGAVYWTAAYSRCCCERAIPALKVARSSKRYSSSSEHMSLNASCAAYYMRWAT